MKDLLKFITCGSVDDGKSTLIGHILYDSKLLYADQEKALELDSKVGSRGGAIDYSLLLDGLTEEREQGITIDVAYRYFTTDARSFIVADTPGHEEYTRNMAVGASFADLSVILIDATKGVLVQTRRHARICKLMGISHFVFAVNKMDLAGYSEERFHEIENEIAELAGELELEQIKVIPVSATEGDNVTKRSEKMSWYRDDVLLTYLEQVDIDENENEQGFTLPVQRVCRPTHEFRGFQGQIESGSISVGDEITSVPSGEKAHVKGILIGDREADHAEKGQPVTVTLDREVDVSRGCVLEKDADVKIADSVTSTILWMDDAPLEEGKNFFVKLGTKMIPGIVTKIHYVIDVNSGEHSEAHALHKNELASVRIALTDKVIVDEFHKHRTLGELILIDRISFQTAACGIVEQVLDSSSGSLGDGRVTKRVRAALAGQTPLTAEFVLNNAKGSFSRSEVEQIEKQLILLGRRTYLYHPHSAEEITEVLYHLTAAGLVVLLALDPEIDAQYSRAHLEEQQYASYLAQDTFAGKTVEEVVSLIQKKSAYREEDAGDKAYI